MKSILAVVLLPLFISVSISGPVVPDEEPFVRDGLLIDVQYMPIHHALAKGFGYTEQIWKVTFHNLRTKEIEVSYPLRSFLEVARKENRRFIFTDSLDNNKFVGNFSSSDTIPIKVSPDSLREYEVRYDLMTRPSGYVSPFRI